MTAHDDRLALALDRLVPLEASAGDWSDAVARARIARRRRALVVLVAAVAAALSLMLATPLGGAIARTLGDFSGWLTGEPGEPVSAEEQRAFDEANARSWNGFPGSPELRRLIRTRVGGVTYDLIGFRTGSSLCLRVKARGVSRRETGGTTTCAPLADLRSAAVPARVLLADWGFGKGDKKATYGVETYTSARAQLTIGIVADGVRAIDLRDERGLHRVRPRSNAFLYAADRPEVGQRVRRLWVVDERGVRRAVPFAPTPFGFGGIAAGGGEHAPGPTHVERTVSGGEIGWLVRSEPRGEPLSVLAPRQRASLRWMRGKFARVITPDPQGLARMVIGFGTYPAHPGTPVTICTALIVRGGSGGGCAPIDVFERMGPFTVGLSLVGGADQFATLSGLASDDVSSLTAYLVTGERRSVPLRDNVFVVDLPRGKFPIRLVAYDRAHRVIGFQELRDLLAGPSPARGRARLVARAVSGDGSVAELSVSPSTDGGRCSFVRIKGPTAVNAMGCEPRRWRRGVLHLGTTASPARFVHGAVRADVAEIEIRYADGRATRVRPREGFVLYAVPERHVTKDARAVEIVGLDARGRELGSLRLTPAGRA